MNAMPAHTIRNAGASAPAGGAVPIADGVAGRAAHAAPELVYGGDVSRRLTPPLGELYQKASKFDASDEDTRSAGYARRGSRPARHPGYLAELRREPRSDP